MDFPLAGWDIGSFDAVDWAPWGSSGTARAKVLASADGFYVALVEAEAGYAGDPHQHDHAEFLFVIDGALHTQGREMTFRLKEEKVAIESKPRSGSVPGRTRSVYKINGSP